MPYNRVIPRDLFNEGNLLKCLGALFIKLENARAHGAILGDGETHGAQDDYSGAPFDICQNEGTGALYVANLPFTVNGTRYTLERPLNSRDAWPLWVEGYETDEFDPIEVFDDDGDLTPEFRAFIGLEG